MSNGCRGVVGKRRCPRPINRHAAPKAAGYWGPRCFALAPLLPYQAKPGCALGPEATVGVLGTGVPRLACLRPAAWHKWWPSMAHLHQLKLKILARGQASRGGRQKASSEAASSGRLAKRWRDQGRGTSRGARDASHDDRDQAGAGLRSVLVSPLVQRGQAQAKASGKGYRFGATRPRPAGRQNGGHRGAQAGVIVRVFGRQDQL